MYDKRQKPLRVLQECYRQKRSMQGTDYLKKLSVSLPSIMGATQNLWEKSII
jgi:hypothetical protein